MVPLLRIRPRRKEVTVPLPWRTPEVADTVFSTPDDGCMTPETCRVTWQRINVYILSHRVGPLLTLNHDARNHVFKIHVIMLPCYQNFDNMIQYIRYVTEMKISGQLLKNFAGETSRWTGTLRFAETWLFQPFAQRTGFTLTSHKCGLQFAQNTLHTVTGFYFFTQYNTLTIF